MPEESIERIDRLAKALGRGAEILDDGDRPDGIVGRTGKSARSFGEIIGIRVWPAGTRGSILPHALPLLRSGRIRRLLRP